MLKTNNQQNISSIAAGYTQKVLMMESFLESKYKKIKKSKEEEVKKRERLKDARLESQKVEHELLRFLKTLSGNKEEISDEEKQAEVFFKKALREFHRGARYLR